MTIIGVETTSYLAMAPAFGIIAINSVLVDLGVGPVLLWIMFDSIAMPNLKTAHWPEVGVVFDDQGRSALHIWKSAFGDAPEWAERGFSDAAWTSVHVPHNWENYHGYAGVSHGNLHGTAWYRHAFSWDVDAGDAGARLYAFFEGVGSYATVYCNGWRVGYHAGGRTTFTVDLTDALIAGANVLAVKAEHPEKIDDLPFVCGGCWGAPNTEGSQPLGIFRPAWLERTGPVRVAPFGAHVLTPMVSEQSARVETRTTLSNPGVVPHTVSLRQSVLDPEGRVVARGEKVVRVAARNEMTIALEFPEWAEPLLWSPESPALHRLRTELWVDDLLSHELETTFGLRWLEWPEIDAPDADHNVVSADRRGELISNGEVPRSPGNNGLTDILMRTPGAPASLAPMGIVVTQSGNTHADWADLRVALNLRSNTKAPQPVRVFCEIQNEGGTIFFHQHRSELILEDGTGAHVWTVPSIHHPHCWEAGDPYLHRVLVEIRSPEGVLWERSETCFGIRPQGWDASTPLNLARPGYAAPPGGESPEDAWRERRLKLNGRPLFLNGTCEYETLLGCDHAFTDEQIAADVKMMHAAGFNAFRDAHHPHNLRYYDHWDRAGIVCWTQMGSHIWFDNERFRENYRQLVREWVMERRNHPSVIIWGIQNESSLPEDFAAELREIIRELDPTSPAWRIATTCNGGKGSDWNVPQEWSGTYGGNCHDYDLKTAQMVGEYGAWRNFGVHTECDYAGDENDRSESWACAAMEIKLRLGEQARDQAIGHFHWAFNSFPNPGRSADNHEGPGNAMIGSINNKGLVTAWHQPSDLYHLFRSNYADAKVDPMVYIVSHTWPDRWKNPVPRKIRVYSNCEAVELFNGVGRKSYGKKLHPGIGRHYVWGNVLPETSLLHAVGYRGGRVVAEDLIRLDYLPEDESVYRWVGAMAPLSYEKALFRVNCGSGESSLDLAGGLWLADVAWSEQGSWGWESWGGQYENIPDDLASRGFTMTPVRGTALQEVYRTYRYGRQYLKYHFKTGPGCFRVRCHFTEPWFGVGGCVDVGGLRCFDVAVNGDVVERDLDIGLRAKGAHRALVREYAVEVPGDTLTLHFPFIRVNQALICGIEILA